MRDVSLKGAQKRCKKHAKQVKVSVRVEVGVLDMRVEDKKMKGK